MPTDRPPGSLHIHTSLAAAEARWRAAWPACAAYAFQCFDWVAAWQVELGESAGWRPCIVEWRNTEERTVLLLPLGIHREGLLRVLGFLGGGMIDYQAPLVDPAWAATLTPATLRQLWTTILATLPAVDLVQLRRMPETLPGGTPNPMARLHGAEHTENAHAARLPADFAQFRATRATRLFADTRRQLRRLEETGTVRLALDIGPGDARDQVMAALAAQKGQRWRDTGNPDAFAEDPGLNKFFARLNHGPLQGLRAVVSALYLDERPIATHWGLRSADRYYWLMPAYDAEWGKFSPGRLLMEAVIQQCIGEKMPVFDLTVGDEAYKALWADEHMALYALRSACNWRGQLAQQAVRLREWARDVPALRKTVQALRGLADKKPP